MAGEAIVKSLLPGRQTADPAAASTPPSTMFEMMTLCVARRRHVVDMLVRGEHEQYLALPKGQGAKPAESLREFRCPSNAYSVAAGPGTCQNSFSNRTHLALRAAAAATSARRCGITACHGTPFGITSSAPPSRRFFGVGAGGEHRTFAAGLASQRSCCRSSQSTFSSVPTAITPQRQLIQRRTVCYSHLQSCQYGTIRASTMWHSFQHQHPVLPPICRTALLAGHVCARPGPASSFSARGEEKARTGGAAYAVRVLTCWAVGRARSRCPVTARGDNHRHGICWHNRCTVTSSKLTTLPDGLCGMLHGYDAILFARILAPHRKHHETTLLQAANGNYRFHAVDNHPPAHNVPELRARISSWFTTPLPRCTNHVRRNRRQVKASPGSMQPWGLVAEPQRA